MLLAWMVMAFVFTLCVGAAAYAVDRLRYAQRASTRGVWAIALAVAVIWPLMVPVVRPLLFTATTDLGTTAGPTGSLASDAGMNADALFPGEAKTVVERISDLPRSAERALTTLANRTPSLVPTVFIVWATMSFVLLLRLLLASRRISALARAATRTSVDEHDVLLADGFGPASVGVRAPRIVLPQWVLALDAPLRTMVLQHEREHCESGDPRFVWGAALATAAMPWNPGVWWLSRRLRLALELDCDVRTLQYGGDPLVYAKLLLFMTQQHAAPASHLRLASSLAASRSHLSRRIVAMQQGATQTSRVMRLALAGAATFAFAAACNTRIPGNAVAPNAAQPDATPALQTPTDTTIAGATLAAEPVAGNPYFEFQVQKPVALTASGSLPYPEMLKTAQVEGTVLASFVVDELGVVDTSTFKVLRSDHELFSNSVRLALSQFKYSPAEIDGKRVKQLVQQPFAFSLDKAPSATAIELERKLREREVAVHAARQNTLPMKPADPSSPYFEFQVEKPAAMGPGASGMVYPPDLRAARVEGKVLASFVVDVDGTVEMSTFKVLKSDHALFTAAVKNALQTMKYLPAEVEGKRVRQVVQQPFQFSLAK